MTKLQLKYYKQIYKVAEKNDSMVALLDINGNELFRNITSVEHVNITDQEKDKDISIHDENKTYPKRKRKTIYY